MGGATFNNRMVWSRNEILKQVERVAYEIKQSPIDDSLVVIGILNGCVFFFADLLKALDVPCEIDFAKISSWQDATCHQDRRPYVDVLSLPKIDIKGKHVLLVDDILDTGGAMEVMQRWAIEKGASTVKIAVLLDKPKNRTAIDQFTGTLINPDYAGFKNVEPCFYYGYGMDIHGIRKNINHIFALIDPTKSEYDVIEA